MKLKRIISTALTVVMLFSSIVALIPIGASAARSSSSSVSESTLTLEEIKTYVNSEYLKYNYETAEEMLSDELEKGYLDYASSENGNYTIYINRYTGFVFYQNNLTGQILTSNPIDPLTGASTDIDRMKLMSQIQVNFFESSNSTKNYNYNSIQWATLYSQVSISEIANGLRVNYTLGDTSTRFLLPGMITAESFFTNIMKPMIERYEQLFADLMAENGAGDEAFTFFNSKKYKPFIYYLVDNKREFDEFILETNEVVDDKPTNCIKTYLKDATAVIEKQNLTKQEKKPLEDLQNTIIKMLTAYSAKNPKSYFKNGEIKPGFQPLYDQMLIDYPITAETPIYVFDQKAFDNNMTSKLREYSNYIKQYCPDYSMTKMYEDEKICGFEYIAGQKPVVRCALEYTFNSDGTLSVRLPANSITFDETVYTLDNISPLHYFGYGDMNNDGYIFFPDGSGSIMEFSDFYSDIKKVATSVEGSVYGQDFCYSSISGQHREQITMPVYGLINEVKANQITNTKFGLETVTNGYFIIIEEGSSLATLGYESGGSSHKYASAYAEYNPYPSDKIDLSQSLSVGALGDYTMVSENKYSGSYVSRIVMLCDEKIGNAVYGEGNFYDTTYSGMAAYYRNFLKADGTLTALEYVSDDIPLYLEALGSMTITSKFLTFPVEKSIPLTTFEDIKTIYDELYNAKDNVNALIEKYTALAEEETNDLLKIEYLNKAEQYEKLLGNFDNIRNVNFKLTGFANGGMNYTYPTKVKWERVCGGKSDFKDLIEESKVASLENGVNFGIYPDFDFLYINNTAAFDGIKTKGNVSRMIDNRYASKQVYNSVFQMFESFFTLVISSDTFAEHFETFNSKYSKYDLKTVSVSTLGSDLNSNFDDKNFVSREESMNNSTALLEEMVVNNGYKIMVDKGNIYSAKYATHILNASIDYSNFRYSSYAVPFVGMILHGYVNYAGAPLNYSGSPAYDVLRAIENGAAPYYIICYQDSAYMKDDENLSKYYGIDYNSWYDEILVTYHELNTMLGDIQSYEIVDHKTVISERIVEEHEMISNYHLLKAEVIEHLDSQIFAAINAAVDSLAGDEANFGRGVKLDADADAIYAQVYEILSVYKEIIDAEVVTLGEGDTATTVTTLKLAIDEVVARYTKEYPGVDENSVVVVFDEIEYSSEYSFTSYSECTDYENYDRTDYTLDNGNVVIVTYRNGNKTVRFVLNYNIYSVKVILDGQEITVDSYGYERINK